MKVGIEPPGLIALEREIEQEQGTDRRDQTDSSSSTPVKQKVVDIKPMPSKKSDKLDSEVRNLTLDIIYQVVLDLNCNTLDLIVNYH